MKAEHCTSDVNIFWIFWRMTRMMMMISGWQKWWWWWWWWCQGWWWWSQAIEEEGTDDDDYDSGGSAGIALTPPDSPGCMRQVVIQDESLLPRTANSIFGQNSTLLLIRTRGDFLLKWTGKKKQNHDVIQQCIFCRFQTEQEKIQNHDVIQQWPFSSQSLELGRAHKKASSIVNATIDPDKVILISPNFLNNFPYFSKSFKQLKR